GPRSTLAGGVGRLVVDEVPVGVEECEHERLFAGEAVAAGAGVVDDALGGDGPAGGHAVQPRLPVQFPVQVEHAVGDLAGQVVGGGVPLGRVAVQHDRDRLGQVRVLADLPLLQDVHAGLLHVDLAHVELAQQQQPLVRLDQSVSPAGNGELGGHRAVDGFADGGDAADVGLLLVGQHHRFEVAARGLDV